MRRFLTKWVTLLIGLGILTLHLPQIEEWLSQKYKYADFGIILVFVALVIINHFLTIISPLKRYEKLNRQKWYILNVLINQINKDYEQYGIRFNLMIPKRKWFIRIEVKKQEGDKEIRKWQLKCKVFDFVWWSKDNPVNKKLKITVNQGIAGKVFREGKGYVHCFDGKEGNDEFNFNKEQKELTKSLKFIDCVPVQEEDENYVDKETDKILAVLNAESELPKSMELFNNETERNKLTERLIELSKICSKII